MLQGVICKQYVINEYVDIGVPKHVYAEIVNCYFNRNNPVNTLFLLKILSINLIAVS